MQALLDNLKKPITDFIRGEVEKEYQMLRDKLMRDLDESTYKKMADVSVALQQKISATSIGKKIVIEMVLDK
jgi:hypothetical protein